MSDENYSRGYEKGYDEGYDDGFIDAVKELSINDGEYSEKYQEYNVKSKQIVLKEFIKNIFDFRKF